MKSLSITLRALTPILLSGFFRQTPATPAMKEADIDADGKISLEEALYIIPSSAALR